MAKNGKYVYLLSGESEIFRDEFIACSIITLAKQSEFGYNYHQGYIFYFADSVYCDSIEDLLDYHPNKDFVLLNMSLFYDLLNFETLANSPTTKAVEQRLLNFRENLI